MTDLSHQPQTLSQNALNFVQANALLINQLAATLGIPATAISAPIEREITSSDAAGTNTAYTIGLAVQPYLGSVSVANFLNTYWPNTISGGNGPIPIFYKVIAPDLLDVGPGKIQIYNAYQNILQNYFATSADNDPAGLAAYKNIGPDQFAFDLQNDPALTIKVYAVIGQQGQAWFQENMAPGAWALLSPDQQSALIEEYTTRGPAAMDALILNTKFVFTPSPWNQYFYMYGDNPINTQAALLLGGVNQTTATSTALNGDVTTITTSTNAINSDVYQTISVTSGNTVTATSYLNGVAYNINQSTVNSATGVTTGTTTSLSGGVVQSTTVTTTATGANGNTTTTSNQFDGSGNLLSTSAVKSFYNPAQTGVLIAQQFVDPDGSGAICTLDNPTGTNPTDTGSLISFAPGWTPTTTVDASNNVNTTLTSTSGSPINFVQAANGDISANVGGNAFSNSVADTKATVDALGDISFVSGSGATASTLIIPVNGAASFTSSQGTINFAANALQGVSSDSSGNVDFSTDDASGAIQGFTYNPTNGDVSVNMAGANGTTFLQDLGAIPTGGALNFSNGLVQITASDGTPTLTLQSNSAAGYVATLLNGGSSVANNYSSSSGQLDFSVMTIENGGTATTVYSNDSNAPWVSQTSVKNMAGNQIGRMVVNADGTEVFEIIDPTTHQVTMSTTVDANKNVTSQTNNATSYNTYVSNIAITAASLLINKLLLPHDLPLSIIAQGFANAVIQSSLNTGTFNIVNQQGNSTGTTSTNITPAPFADQFAGAVVNVAGGVAGSMLGNMLAKDLGLPPQVMSLLGGVAGSAAAQVYVAPLVENLVNSAAKKLGVELTDGTVQTTTSFAASFVDGLESAGANLAGSELGSLIAGNSEDAQIGGEVGGAVGSYWGPLGSFAGSFIGELIGGLLDPPRGAAYAETNIGFGNGKFYIMSTTTDNNGSPTLANNMGVLASTLANQILTAIGGTASCATIWSIGYTGSTYITFQPNGAPRLNFGDPNSAVDNVVMSMLGSTSITGGNAYMKSVFAKVINTGVSLETLTSDLKAAQDYSYYVANPAAFDNALAASGNASQYQAWQTELALMQALSVAGSGTTSLVQMIDSQQTSVNSNNAEIIMGNNDIATVNGINTQLFMVGANSMATFNGSSGAITSYGAGDGVVINGNNITSTLYGAGDWGNVYGAVDMLTVNGSSGGFNLVGSGDGVAIGGTTTTVTLFGTNDWANVTGATNMLNLCGSSQGATASGANDGVAIYGTATTVALSGTSDWASMLGANDMLYLNGSNEAANVTGSGDGVAIGGTGSSATLSGVKDWGSITGSFDAFYLNGAGLNATASGANDGVVISGNGCSVTLFGSNDWATMNAANDTVTVVGTTDAVTVNGGGDTVNLYSSGNTVIGASAGHINVNVLSGENETFQNFLPTDTFDITNHAFTASTQTAFTPTVAGQSGLLTVSDSVGIIAQFQIQGQYISFAVKSDGNGGILVVDPPLPSNGTDSSRASLVSTSEGVISNTDVSSGLGEAQMSSAGSTQASQETEPWWRTPAIAAPSVDFTGASSTSHLGSFQLAMLDVLTQYAPALTEPTPSTWGGSYGWGANPMQPNSTIPWVASPPYQNG